MGKVSKDPKKFVDNVLNSDLYRGFSFCKTLILLRNMTIVSTNFFMNEVLIWIR